jgi:hypothetical protein
MRTHGHTAIEAARNDSGIVLNKYEDPTEGAREKLTVWEAEAVASEDPGLIWAEVGDWGGARVEGGQGDDHDTGVVDRVDGDMATVRWDSGVVTQCPVEYLRRV